MEQKAKKRMLAKRKYMEEGLSEIQAGKQAERENKPGIRALDLYIWAVLLGNTELAIVLLGECQDPMRAALLGARICNHMADVLPIERDGLKEDASKHEDFAIALLDLCANQNDAKVLLLTPARHWVRNVLELAVNSDMKKFTAHRHCQNLISAILHGDVDSDLFQPSDTSSGGASQAMLPIRFERSPEKGDWVIVLAHAAFPCLLKLRRAPKAFREPIRSDFYRIPYVKQVLRMTLYHGYCILFSIVVMSRRLPDTMAFCAKYAVPPEWLLVVWTGSLILDEWNQYVVAPETFEVDLWNAYDYVSLTLTTFALFLKLGPLSDVDTAMFLIHSVVNTTQSLLGGGGGSTASAASGGFAAAAGRMLADQANYNTTTSSLLPVLPGSGGGIGGGGGLPLPTADSTLFDQHHHRELRGGGGGGGSIDKDDDAFAFTYSLPQLIMEMDDNLLAVVNVIVWVRVLQHYSTQREIGVLIIMIIEMVSDLKIWMLLTAVFTFAFMVTFVAIASDGPVEKTIAGSLWAMYGEFYTDYFIEYSGMLGEVLLWIFALVSNVLLVNLLIAMMSETYQKIKDKADVEWKFGRVNSVLEAVERTHPVPPPFSVPLMLFRFVKWILGKTCYGDDRCCFPPPGASWEDLEDEDEKKWRNGGTLYTQKKNKVRIAKQVLQMYRRQEDANNETSEDGRLKRIEKLVLDLMVMNEDQERELGYLRQEVSGGKAKEGAGDRRAGGL